MIDMEAEFIKRIRSITGRFQRNRDGQFVGYINIGGESLACWLVFDDHYGKHEEPGFLKLTLTTPYKGPTC